MSGHSKWAQIKRSKGVTDVKRGQAFTKLGREISVAVREGGPSPDANARLRLAIERARAANMAIDTIERAIKRAAGGGEEAQLDQLSYEGYGPGGAAIIVEVLTDNRNRAVAEVRSVFTRGGGSLGEAGCVAWMFDRRGVVQVDAERIKEDDLLEKALDAGAVDVKRVEKAFEITTAADEMEAVRSVLEGQGVPVLEAAAAMIPQSTVRVEGKDAAALLRLIEALEEQDDVQAVYSNYDIPDEVLDAISAA